jgi:ABC-type amino acid transport substrate-binding protein
MECNRAERRGFDMVSCPARLMRAMLLAAVLATGAGAARAAEIGAQLGLDRSGIDGDSPPNSQYTDKFGLVAGIQGEIALAHDLSLSLQPSFVQKQSGLLIAPANRGGSTTELELSFDYVSVPLLMKFAAAGGRTYVSGGVTVDFLTSATLSGESADRDVTSAYTSTGFGAVLGFGVVFPAGRTRFTTELRFVQGISDMTTGSAAAAAGALAPRLHSSGLQLIVGNLLPVGKH